MVGHRSISIRTSVWLAVAVTAASTLLGAGALYAWQLSRNRQFLEQSRARVLAECYAALVEPLLVSGRGEAVQPHLEQLRWHPSVCLLAVLDAHGRPLAARGNLPLLDRYLQGVAGGSTGVHLDHWELPAEPSRGYPALVLVRAPMPGDAGRGPCGGVLCAVRPMFQTAVDARQTWKHFSCLLLAAGVGFALGLLFLRANVVRPLAVLAQGGRQALAAGEAALPIHRKDEIGGIAQLMADISDQAELWRRRTLDLHEDLSRRIDTETARINRELRDARRKIWSDPLTGLGNRRLLDDQFARICRSQQAAGADLAVAMIDVDHFKKLNDTLGHHAGDELLKFIGELLRQSLREGDLALRFGGDEFALVLPGVGLENARSIAERTIRLFAQRAGLLAVEPRPTMSVGIATLLAHRPGSPEELLHMADMALYAAKRAGKAQVAVYRPDLPREPGPAARTAGPDRRR